MKIELNNQVTTINTAIDSFKQFVKEINGISPKIEAINAFGAQVLANTTKEMK